VPFSLRPDTQWVFLGRASRPVYEHLLVMVDFFPWILRSIWPIVRQFILGIIRQEIRRPVLTGGQSPRPFRQRCLQAAFACLQIRAPIVLTWPSLRGRILALNAPFCVRFVCLFHNRDLRKFAGFLSANRRVCSHIYKQQRRIEMRGLAFT